MCQKKGGFNMFSSYQEMYYASKSMEFIVRKRLDMVHINSPKRIKQSDIDKITETCKWALEKG